MSLFKNYLSRILIPALFVSLFCLSGCASTKGVSGEQNPQQAGVSIAVFPVENLSGTAVPLRAIRESLIRELTMKGFRVLEEGTLEKFMVRNRVRYASGLDELTAQALKKEMGVDGVLITSVELYSDTIPPKVALTSRLVSTGEIPVILWADGVGLAGDDRPGILGLGLIEDSNELLKKALSTLASSLAVHQRGQAENRPGKLERKFDPKIVYRSPALIPGKKHTVAIIPFFNQSDRKNAGEIMVLHFIRSLKRSEVFDLIEPGLTREAFLSLRMIMDEGVSLSDANALFGVLNADMILAGKVLDYQDYQGGYGKPKVDFSVQLIEKTTQKILWSSFSHNEGDDGVFFFDWGRVNTAYVMADQMVMAVGNSMKKKEGTR
jgi:TolB-like protein